MGVNKSGYQSLNMGYDCSYPTYNTTLLVPMDLPVLQGP